MQAIVTKTSHDVTVICMRFVHTALRLGLAPIYLASFLSLYLLFLSFLCFFPSLCFRFARGRQGPFGPDPQVIGGINRNCSPPLFTLFFSFPHFLMAGARASPPPPPTELQLVCGKLVTYMPLIFFSSSSFSLFSFTFLPSLLFFDVGGGGAGGGNNWEARPSPPPDLLLFPPYSFSSFISLSLLFPFFSFSLSFCFSFFPGGGGGGLDPRLE